MSYKLNSEDKYKKLTKASGIETWEELVAFVQKLPYGRISNRADYSLVLSEMMGTCSSKHAFLKQMANLNNIPNVQLILGMYRMNEQNTPKIGTALKTHNLEYIPEAHCYLKIDGCRFDYTSSDAEIKKIEDDIICEIEIEPEQTDKFKIDYHQNFVKNWIKNEKILLDFDTVWAVREDCIQNLSNSKQSKKNAL